MLADEYADIARRMGKQSVVAPPAPPQMECRWIFFDSGCNLLTPAAHGIIQAMADHIIREKPALVKCVGHTDSVGSAPDNLLLGQQRALVVRSWLYLRQVPVNLIVCVSEGSRSPMVATAPGVSESANRRVEVVLE